MCATPRDGARQKVLVVDDSPMSLQIARARLKKANLEVLCASDGKQGLLAARQQRPDVILLDVDMPGLSGFEVCKALKADEDVSMIPVIFLTGSTDTWHKVRGLDLGAVDYVTKPFDAFELCARVRAALRTKHLQDLLASHAQIDPLTELYNRRALNERMQQEWSRLMRYGGILSCILLDLDHFKRINDSYGHNVGDTVLYETACALRRCGRKGDLAARFGGEEFLLLAPNTPCDQAAMLAERVRRAIGELSIVASEKTLSVTASFGVAESRDLPCPEALFKAADTAMYCAKEEGRNRVKLATAEGCIDPEGLTGFEPEILETSLAE
jgi:diguanylate cyclase (GGDEF)-like protein